MDVREALLDIREWSGGPPGCPGVVESSSRLFESGRETLRMSGIPTEISGSGQRPSLMSGSSREDLPDVRECSRGSPGSSEVVGWPSRMSGNGREALLDVR